MALVKLKPTSPGRRHAVKVVNKELHKGKPWAALVEKKNRGCGRKRAYRIIDFKRDKDGIPARVERIEYDPNRSANIALVLYADGERRYIIAPKGMTVGQEIFNGPESPIKAGNTLPLRNIPVGSTIHGKAGAKRWRGVRPTVRGVAMNPVDHPHGGGEGKTGTGRAPVTPWGQLTKGYRTRNSKRTDSMIVQRRNSK